MSSFQRIGSISNAHVGREFELLAQEELKKLGVLVELNFPVEIGISNSKKCHNFDLGSEKPAVLVECKSHRWTSGKNVPSAKLTVWNEAMYYFFLAPTTFRKIFFVLRDVRRNESLAEYYVRQYGHLIPQNIEFWEYDPTNETTAKVAIE